ncbi:MAG: hypothetical protein ACTTJ6_08545 [Treponema sp.]
MKKSITLSIFVATLTCLLISCQFLIDNFKETFTTISAKYVERLVSGIEIKDFEKDAKFKETGLIDGNGNVPATFTFDKVGDDVLVCKELPLDFVKISNKSGERSITSSKYVGTWEAIMPTPIGFRKIYLDLKTNSECSIYFDFYPNKGVEIKTRKETVLQGHVTHQGGYVLTVNNATGYAKSMERFAGKLEVIDSSSEFLLANFKFDGKNCKVKLFKLASQSTATKKSYVGTGDFAKEKVGTEITFEVENDSSFKLTIPSETKLPKAFGK